VRDPPVQDDADRAGHEGHDRDRDHGLVRLVAQRQDDDAGRHDERSERQRPCEGAT